jgi:hypothetical protein
MAAVEIRPPPGALGTEPRGNFESFRGRPGVRAIRLEFTLHHR